jgi:hypothetical protein
MINRIKKYTAKAPSQLRAEREPAHRGMLLDSFQKIIVDQAGMIAELEEKLQAKNDRMNRMIIKVRKLIALAEKMKGGPLNGKKEES